MSCEGPEVEAPEWPTCLAVDGCLGIRVDGNQACLRHLSGQARQTVLDSYTPGAEVKLQGTLIESSLLDEIFAKLRSKDGVPTFGAASFQRAQFEDGAEFKGVLFDGWASFENAWFKCANFDEAKFKSGVRFKGAHFEGDVSFRNVTTSPEPKTGARFDGAEFNGVARFDNAQLRSSIYFTNAKFVKPAWFKAAHFTGGNIRFDDAQFCGEARFDGARFAGQINFKSTHFQEVWFTKAQFKTTTTLPVRFGAKFGRKANFDEAHFLSDVSFNNAEFIMSPSFKDTDFSGQAGFDTEIDSPKVKFHSGADFTRAKFNRGARFHRTQFNGHAIFAKSEFSGNRWFEETEFFLEGEAKREVGGKAETQFNDANFKEAGKLGPLLTSNLLVLDNATFDGITGITIASPQISCVRATFNEQLMFRARFAEIVLDETRFARPSVFAFAREKLFNECRIPPDDQLRKPRILSPRQVDVSTLTLIDIDLSACLFQDAHNLDKLRIQGPRTFAESPGPWRLRIGRKSIPVWQRWSRRQTLAEEHHWRTEQPAKPDAQEPETPEPETPEPETPEPETPEPETRSSSAVPEHQSRLVRPGWHSPETMTPTLVTERTRQPIQRLQPDRLAVLYRSLRKAEEDAKNEPGAADFYYGEMEMRRNVEGIPWIEGLILRLYWLVSGYALRAWRSIATLAAVILIAAVIFAFWGFPPPEADFRPVGINDNGALVYQQRPSDLPSGIERLPAAIRFSAESASALLRGPDRTLTPLGEWLEILLRFVGPVLLGLAVVSVRGRVRR